MNRSPDDLRRDAALDRERAEELAEDNPGYAEYLELRANWREYLARKEEEFDEN